MIDIKEYTNIINCESCNNKIGLKNIDNDILLIHEVEMWENHSYYYSVECPYCGYSNKVNGFIPLENSNEIMLGDI